MTDTPGAEPVHGCTIDGQPAMPILISEYNQLVGDLAALRAARDRVRALPREPQVVQRIRIHGLPDQDAYNRGWSSAISAVHAALDQPKDPAP